MRSGGRAVGWSAGLGSAMSKLIADALNDGSSQTESRARIHGARRYWAGSLFDAQGGCCIVAHLVRRRPMSILDNYTICSDFVYEAWDLEPPWLGRARCPV